MRSRTHVPAVVGKAAIALSSLAAAVLAPAISYAQEISDEWQFGATIYGWLPDISGTVVFPSGAESSIGVDISTILDHLKMTAQGSFEVQKGRWGAYTDVIYLDVGESNSQTRGITIGDVGLPASVTAAVDLDMKTTLWTLGGSYRVASEPASTFDVLAGVRLMDLQQNLNWEFTGDFGSVAPPPRTGSRSVSADNWDVIAGVKGRFGLGADHKWIVPYYFDVGTGDSDLTLQGVLGVGYVFGWGELGVAWRYMEYEFESGNPIKDVDFSGPALGATFRW
jgi:hypothetical protein